MSRGLTLEILSYWHCGSGLGRGPALDAVVRRGRNGLPILPGKTLKGLLRDAAREAEGLGLLEQGTSSRLYGSDPFEEERGAEEAEATLEACRYRTTRGICHIGTAWPGGSQQEVACMKDWAEQPGSRLAVSQLFRSLASTKIDENGIASDKSLRSIEVVVPMTLYAELAWTGGDRAEESETTQQNWLRWIETSLPFLRGVGGHRTRGLGRTMAKLERGKEQ
jgi:hypothetical protein